MPACLREDTPRRAATRKGALRMQLEHELAQRCAQGQLRATVVRAGRLFWWRHGHLAGSGHRQVAARRPPGLPGPTHRPHAWAYLPDLASTLFFVALAHRAPQACLPFERFHFPGHTLTGAELLDGIVQAAHDLGLDPGTPWSRAGMPWA